MWDFNPAEPQLWWSVFQLANTITRPHPTELKFDCDYLPELAEYMEDMQSGLWDIDSQDTHCEVGDTTSLLIHQPSPLHTVLTLNVDPAI